MGFEPCCCCCSSRVGSLVIGYLQIIGSIASIAIVSAEVHKARWSEDEHVTASMIITLVLDCLSLLFGLALIRGVRQNAPEFIKKWIVSRIVHLIVAIINFIIAMTKEEERERVDVWSSDIVQMVVAVWFLITVHHYYKQLLRTQSDNPPANHSIQTV